MLFVIATYLYISGRICSANSITKKMTTTTTTKKKKKNNNSNNDNSNNMPPVILNTFNYTAFMTRHSLIKKENYLYSKVENSNVFFLTGALYHPAEKDMK